MCKCANEVNKICQTRKKLLKLQRTSEKEFEDVQKRLVNENGEYKRIYSQEMRARDELDKISFKYEGMKSDVEEMNQEIEAICKQRNNYRNSYLESKKAVGTFARFLMRVLRKKEFDTLCSIENSYIEGIGECTRKQEETEAILDKAKIELQYQEDQKKKASHNLTEVQGNLKQIGEKITATERDIKNLEEKIESIKNEKEECGCQLKEYRNKWGVILDDEYISDILSSDEVLSKNAQVENPWITEKFDREREKLFYYALQMTREFFINSNACRVNMRMLEVFWKNQIVEEKDRKAMAGSLYQTLFLLTPIISSTFASVGKMFADVNEPSVIGTLVIDEAGQAQPQYAIGSLFRSRKAIVVGDPRQIEPVVTDDMDLLKKAYSDSIYNNYKDKTLSVQKCADLINPFGTSLPTNIGDDEWIGCPLLVHRRCISPMFEISNSISYNGIMKQETFKPSERDSKKFISIKSKWINVSGVEKGDGNHYVQKQGEWVCACVKKAFEKNLESQEMPSLFIITPFKLVVSGIKSCLNQDEGLRNSPSFEKWRDNCIGTIHTFQGKEANEVIFVLGCDEKQKHSKAVTDFVNSNMVNVAVTRAKYRLYIVGDMDVWKENRYVMKAKALIDTLPIKRVAEILDKQAIAGQDGEKKRLFEEACREASLLPEASSFVLEVKKDEYGDGNDEEYDIDPEMFISTIDREGFLKGEIGNDQYKRFGFSKESFEALPADVKSTLLMGMKLYYLLEPVYQSKPDLDTSCCCILFCKGMELYLRENFAHGLKKRLPDFRISSSGHHLIPLKNAKDRDFMIGVVHYIIDNNKKELGEYMIKNGEASYSAEWWKSFCEKLKEFADERNMCCHPNKFDASNMIKLLKCEFMTDDEGATRNPKIGGVFFESEVGRKLEDYSC